LLDIDFTNTKKPKAGLFLVSEPFLDSDYFRRSVILLCEHNEKGSFGFVLNNFLEENFEGLPPFILNSNPKISIGGPVEVSNLYFIHTLGNTIAGTTSLSDGIYLGGDFDELKTELSKCENPEERVRYFLGYSGWDAGQLNDEINEKSWVVCEPQELSWIMNTRKDGLWEDCLKSLGSKFEVFTNFPINPNNN